ncbi:hypothetical protein NMY22_g16617 [Coprinellus aureogranulatus]|nr:hypothetical protein NMY22_g16617 [Coprinellus aureogranulatus]
MLGPNYLNILRQHFPIPRCPDGLPLHHPRPPLPASALVIAPPASAASSSAERVIQDSADVDDEADTEVADDPTNIDADALPRLRPKNKLKMTERAKKVYRNC